MDLRKVAFQVTVFCPIYPQAVCTVHIIDVLFSARGQPVKLTLRVNVQTERPLCIALRPIQTYNGHHTDNCAICSSCAFRHVETNYNNISVVLQQKMICRFRRFLDYRVNSQEIVYVSSGGDIRYVSYISYVIYGQGLKPISRYLLNYTMIKLDVFESCKNVHRYSSSCHNATLYIILCTSVVTP